MFKEWLHRKMETNYFVRDMMHMCYEIPTLAVPMIIMSILFMVVFVDIAWYILTKHFVVVLVGTSVVYIVWRIVKWFGGEYKNHYH